MRDFIKKDRIDMKDLIIIGAYCPDQEREELLNNCLNSLLPLKDDFDFLITSHSYIPEYITRKVDYVFYDKQNELLIDWEYFNKPWFSPIEGMCILSTLVSEYSTFLASYRIFIGGLGIAKNFKYNKVHWVEYDSFFTNYDDFYENSNLLEENTAVLYKKVYKEYEKNLDWGLGCFQSININKLDDIFLTYDREKLIDILEKCPNKTNEKITQEIYYKNDGKIFFKDFHTLLQKNNKFNLSENTKKDSMDYWTVPFYNAKEDIVSVVGWNNKDETPIHVNFVINNQKIISFDNLPKFNWRIENIGKIEEIDSILILVNGKVKKNIFFTDKLREVFKKTNYVQFL
jgi:hypothetical protein